MEEFGEPYQLELEPSVSDSEISIEIIPEERPHQKTKKTRETERQIAFKRARAWALD
jgi:hypothetical protein